MSNEASLASLANLLAQLGIAIPAAASSSSSTGARPANADPLASAAADIVEMLTQVGSAIAASDDAATDTSEVPNPDQSSAAPAVAAPAVAAPAVAAPAVAAPLAQPLIAGFFRCPNCDVVNDLHVVRAPAGAPHAAPPAAAAGTAPAPAGGGPIVGAAGPSSPGQPCTEAQAVTHYNNALARNETHIFVDA
ncbi:hypothetical protein EYR40_001959 [Pleurotus pulmonarius]|nr:hypothetical protein EYR40_001959 [Pleurotus pulmonarius]